MWEVCAGGQPEDHESQAQCNEDEDGGFRDDVEDGKDNRDDDEDGKDKHTC
jgi:hypothetical protein